MQVLKKTELNSLFFQKYELFSEQQEWKYESFTVMLKLNIYDWI